MIKEEFNSIKMYNKTDINCHGKNNEIILGKLNKTRDRWIKCLYSAVYSHKSVIIV